MSDMDRQELLGKRILQNCRNELYLDFPYLDGAFASLEYEADNSIITIGTDGEKIYFNPTFLLKQYIRDPETVRRGYLHMLLHCLYLHIFMIQDKFASVFNRCYSPLAVRRIYPHASVVNAERYGVSPAEIYQRR